MSRSGGVNSSDRRPRCRAGCSLVVTCVATAWSLVGATPAQDPDAPRPEPDPAPGYVWGHAFNRPTGDLDPWIVTGGVRYTDPRLGITVRADRAALIADASSTAAAIQGASTESGLPRRIPRRPNSRRALDVDVLRARLASFISALQGAPSTAPTVEFDLEALRAIYLEGDVAVIRDGLEVLRAESLYWSALDDRVVLQDVTLRLTTDGSGPAPMVLTLRAPEMVRQGRRFVGRNVSVTTSRAGEPSFAVVSGELEVLERGHGFEIRSRGNELEVGGVTLLPVPDQTWSTTDQDNLLIKSVTTGYSSLEGAQVTVGVGSSFNETGGALHELLTGRPADEFRGDWRLDVGWIQERGFPVRPEFRYRADGVYRGETRAFLMEDEGRNFREIAVGLDGQLIDEPTRTLVHSENRFLLSENTSLDLSLFDASDQAVWSEFFRGEYLEAEQPETSAHLRWADGGAIGTLTARYDLAGYSYTDSRALAPRAIEELPRATFDWYSIPIAELPYDGRLLLTASTDVGLLRSSAAADAPVQIDDRTWRADQRIELSAPYYAGPVSIRPFAEARYTWFEDTLVGGSDGRSALRAGLEFGTRLQRVFGEPGDGGAIRHTILPTVRFDHTFVVDGDPDRYFQFDSTDALRRGGNIRIGLLQRLETRDPDPHVGVRDFFWLDLAQNFDPDGSRDELGTGDSHALGLFEFEAILRPFAESVSGLDLRLIIEGEQDWNNSELRTFNNFLQLTTGPVTWIGEYRSDRTESGQIGGGVSTLVRGRFVINGRTLYDLERDEYLNYTIGLTRIDPDWALNVSVIYDNVFDDVTLRVMFEPRFGGLFRTGPRHAAGGADFSAVEHWAY